MIGDHIRRSGRCGPRGSPTPQIVPDLGACGLYRAAWSKSVPSRSPGRRCRPRPRESRCRRTRVMTPGSSIVMAYSGQLATARRAFSSSTAARSPSPNVSEGLAVVLDVNSCGSQGVARVVALALLGVKTHVHTANLRRLNLDGVQAPDPLLLLLPPSEGKREGGDGPASNRPTARIGTTVGRRRIRVVAALRKARGGGRLRCSSMGPMADARTGGESREPVKLGGAPTMPAWQRYSGVVWDRLGPATLADRSPIIVVSGLHGLVGAESTAARLPAEDVGQRRPARQTVDLVAPGGVGRAGGPGEGPLRRRPPLPGAPRHVRGGSRCEGVAVSFVEKGGGGRAVGHMAKAAKGYLTPHVVEATAAGDAPARGHPHVDRRYVRPGDRRADRAGADCPSPIGRALRSARGRLPPRSNRTVGAGFRSGPPTPSRSPAYRSNPDVADYQTGRP